MDNQTIAQGIVGAAAIWILYYIKLYHMERKDLRFEGLCKAIRSCDTMEELQGYRSVIRLYERKRKDPAGALRLWRLYSKMHNDPSK